MDPVSEIVKKRRAAKRAEFYNAGKQKVDGKWVNVGWAPTEGYKSKASKTGGTEAVTDFQKKVRAEKRKAFASSGYVKENGKWVKTVKGFS